jgi:type II secretory pathway component PulJ
MSERSERSKRHSKEKKSSKSRHQAPEIESNDETTDVADVIIEQFSRKGKVRKEEKRRPRFLINDEQSFASEHQPSLATEVPYYNQLVDAQDFQELDIASFDEKKETSRQPVWENLPATQRNPLADFRDFSIPESTDKKITIRNIDYYYSAEDVTKFMAQEPDTIIFTRVHWNISPNVFELINDLIMGHAVPLYYLNDIALRERFTVEGKRLKIKSVQRSVAQWELSAKANAAQTISTLESMANMLDIAMPMLGLNVSCSRALRELQDEEGKFTALEQASQNSDETMGTMLVSMVAKMGQQYFQPRAEPEYAEWGRNNNVLYREVVPQPVAPASPIPSEQSGQSPEHYPMPYDEPESLPMPSPSPAPFILTGRRNHMPARSQSRPSTASSSNSATQSLFQQIISMTM